MTFNSHVERAHCKPWGLDGGGDATGNEVAIRVGGKWKTDFPNAKVLVAYLEPGDAFRMRSGGGGGYGSPLDRPIADVEADAKQGYISLEAARDGYGVVLDPNTFVADVPASERLRAAMRKALPASAASRQSAIA
jgi:N-methylhydantoinase B